MDCPHDDTPDVDPVEELLRSIPGLWQRVRRDVAHEVLQEVREIIDRGLAGADDLDAAICTAARCLGSLERDLMRHGSLAA